jgi:hypothetical protein
VQRDVPDVIITSWQLPAPIVLASVASVVFAINGFDALGLTRVSVLRIAAVLLGNLLRFPT